MVEQVLSGRAVGPQRYVRDQDEWVVVLAGAAALEVDGEPVALGRDQWLFLPSGVAHTVVDAEPGTSWLALHLR